MAFIFILQQIKKCNKLRFKKIISKVKTNKNTAMYDMYFVIEKYFQKCEKWMTQRQWGFCDPFSKYIMVLILEYGTSERY